MAIKHFCDIHGGEITDTAKDRHVLSIKKANPNTGSSELYIPSLPSIEICSHCKEDLKHWIEERHLKKRRRRVGKGNA